MNEVREQFRSWDINTRSIFMVIALQPPMDGAELSGKGREMAFYLRRWFYRKEHDARPPCDLAFDIERVAKGKATGQFWEKLGEMFINDEPVDNETLEILWLSCGGEPTDGQWIGRLK